MGKQFHHIGGLVILSKNLRPFKKIIIFKLHMLNSGNWTIGLLYQQLVVQKERIEMYDSLELSLNLDTQTVVLKIKIACYRIKLCYIWQT